MFDDKPIAPQGGSAPQNLPLGEPEDLFSQTDDVLASPNPASPAAPVAPASNPADYASNSALDAGILRPKEPQIPSQSFPQRDPGMMPPPPVSSPLPGAPLDYTQSMNSMKEPSMSRGILVVIIVVVAVLLLGGAGWWVYRYLNVPAAPVTPDISETSDDTSSPDEEETQPEESTDEEVVPTTPSEELPIAGDDTTSTQPVDETILFGDATDTDADGLDDKREETLGTDPEKSDTDADELSDGDEVIIWGTNPLNPDTDGDSFLDGKEIKSGFSPKGAGKLFEVKPSSSTTSP